MTTEQMMRIIDAFSNNQQLNRSFRATEFIKEIFTRNQSVQAETKDAWIRLYAICYSSGYIGPSEFLKNELVPDQLLDLFISIEKRYPDAEACATAYQDERYKDIFERHKNVSE